VWACVCLSHIVLIIEGIGGGGGGEGDACSAYL